jgi:thioredoxin-related protein
VEKVTRIVWAAIAVAALWANGLWPSSVSVAGEASPKKIGKYMGAKATEYPVWFKESFLEFRDDITEAAADGKRVIVMFHQHNCPYCNALVQRNLSQKHIEEKVRQHFDVVALNLWGDRDVVSVDGEPYTVRVETAIAGHPPHRAGLDQFGHPVPR